MASLTNFERAPKTVGASTTTTGGNTPEDLIASYNVNTTYTKGDFVVARPNASNEWPGLYQYVAETPAKGKLPTDSSYWAQIVAPGPVVLLQGDVLSPTLPALSAPGGTEAATITISGTVAAGATLGSFTLAAGKGYRVEVSEPRPSARGASLPDDVLVKLFIRPTEVNNADGTTTVSLLAKWYYTALATATAVAAISASALTARIKVIEV